MGLGDVKTATLMIDIQATKKRLQDHVKMLTVTIGERSVLLPENLEKTRACIEKFYQDIGVTVHCEPYVYRNFKVSRQRHSGSTGDSPSFEDADRSS